MKHEITSINTKKTLAESLKNIMRKKNFSKITVSEIVSDCGVNRKTFYYHFEDKYALLKWMFEVEAIEVVKHFDLLVDYEEALFFIMDYIEENDYIINCAYDSIGRDELKRFFFADFNGCVLSIIEKAEKEKGKTLEEEYKNFLCYFYTEALAGLLIDWIKKNLTEDRKQITDYIVNTIRGAFLGILDRIP